MKILTNENVPNNPQYNIYTMHIRNLTPDTEYKVTLACVSNAGASQSRSLTVSTRTAGKFFIKGLKVISTILARFIEFFFIHSL